MRAKALRIASATLSVAAIAAPSPAGALPYAPPPGQVYAGVNDTAVAQDFTDFAALLGKPHLPVVQAFHTWGTNPSEALARWQGYRARGVLAISTSPGWGFAGRITPRQIAEGDGDDYLLLLNSRLARSNQITYLRPLGEPNNYHNAYAALNANGSLRGADYSQSWYKQAWRRMVTIVRGGGARATIDGQLAAMGLPPIQDVSGKGLPATLEAPSVAFIWCPLVYGSPRVRGNAPQKFWPGAGFVDWVGTDTYSKYPAFTSLSRFYRAFRGKPFAIGEWGVWDSDNPRFVKSLFRWQRAHKRVRMMIYHMSFAGRAGPMSLYRWPRSAAASRFQMRNPLAYPAYAPEWTP